MNCTLVVLTYNEESCIESCINSAERIFSKILVIDSGSNDRTLEILNNFNNVEVIFNKFNNFSEQRNFALKNVTTQWVFFLDADETINYELADSLKNIPIKNNCVYKMRRHNYLWGKRLKFYGEKDYQTRLLPVNPNCYYKSQVHEYLSYPQSYKLMELDGAIVHKPKVSISSMLNKQIKYTELDLQRHIENKSSIIKMLLKPFARFFITYFIKLSVFDGYRGFILSYLSFNYDFLVALRYLKYIKESNNE